MKYTKEINVPIEKFFNSMIKMQTNYFSNLDPDIKTITEGTCVNTNIKTKLNSIVTVKLKVLEINYPYKYEQQTLYGNNTIKQSFLLKKVDSNHTLVTYSEESTFESKNAEYSYKLTSFFYKFIFNKQVKKRISIIASESMAQTIGG